MTDGAAGFGDLFGDLWGALGGNPFAAVTRSVDQFRRSTEELLGLVSTARETMDNLNSVATRMNRLLDDIEEPIRAAVPIVARVPAQLGDFLHAIDELNARLRPLTQMIESAGMFGLKSFGNLLGGGGAKTPDPAVPPPPPPPPPRPARRGSVKKAAPTTQRATTGAAKKTSAKRPPAASVKRGRTAK